MSMSSAWPKTLDSGNLDFAEKNNVLAGF